MEQFPVVGQGLLVAHHSVLLIQPIAALQIPEGSDIGQRNGDSKLILFSQWTQIEAIKANVHSEATKIVRALRHHLVSETFGNIIVDAERSAKPSAFGLAVNHASIK